MFTRLSDTYEILPLQVPAPSIIERTLKKARLRAYL